MTKSKLTIGLIVAAAALPSGAVAMPAQENQGLRSPDAQDAASQVSDTSGQSLRSPDAQDAADPTQQSPTPTPTPSVATTVTDGFDWGDAGIGASILLGLLAVAGGTFIVVSSHRGRHTRMG
jgi:hypothetical protein